MLYPTLLNRYVAIDNCHRKVYQGIKDHLGNICAVVRSSDNTPVQRTTYYASGVPMAENLGPDVPPSLYYAMGVQYTENFGRDAQPYLYNGKEFIEAYGLNEYDSQARWYYAPIMRTTTMDPLCEKYYHLSPYSWCGNNPIAIIDPDGSAWYTPNGLFIPNTSSEWKETIRWTDCTSQDALNEAGIKGTFLGEAVVVFNGYYDEQLGKGNNFFGEGAKLAKAIVFGPQDADDIATYDAFTMSSDYNEYGAIKDGDYSLDYTEKRGPMGTHWAINNKGPVDCINDYNTSWYKHKDTNPYSPTQKDKTYVHCCNKNGAMLPKDDKGKYHPLSTGCLIISPVNWTQFNNQLQGIKKAHLILRRQ